MRKELASIALLLAATSGCASSQTRPTATGSGTDTTGAASGPSYLVWVVYNDVTDGEEARRRGPRTFRIEVAGAPAGYQVTESLPGVVLALDGRLYRWHEQQVPVPLFDCEDLADEGGGPHEPVGQGVATGAVVEPLGGGDPIEIVAAPRPEDVNEFQHRVTLLGTVGPHLFVRTDATHYSCGAHGGVTSSFLMWDLSRRAAAPPFTDEELAALAADERPRALAALTAEGQDQIDLDLSAADVELAAVAPTLSLDGFVLRLLFSAPACYACGDGIWSSYTRSVWVESRRLPAILAPHAEVPAPVLSFTRQLSDDDPRAQVGGFTVP